MEKEETMATFQLFVAVVVIFGTIYFLAKRFETRMVLTGAGLLMCIFALNPMAALDGFAKSMTSAGLIQSICSAMGFAYVMKLTTCDAHLVRLLLKPVKNIGFFLIPMAVFLTFFINVAITSAAGCAAAVGATMIPLLIAAGVRPAMAAAAVLAGTFGSTLSPGYAHTAVIAEIAKKEIMDIVAFVSQYALVAGGLTVVGVAIMGMFFRDYQKPALAGAGGVGSVPGTETAVAKTPGEGEVERVKVLWALAPLVPLAILIVTYFLRQDKAIMDAAKNIPALLSLLKVSVPQAMIIGAIYGLLITWSSPAEVTRKFFDGMGHGYGEVIGIIIAASVFAAGLEACGAIKWFTGMLTDSQSFARWGSTLGPFFMGLISGSGDAAAMAFNKSITPHAMDFGFEPHRLGMAAALCGSLGRTASPIAGVAIVCAGLANVSPIELVKRTAPVMAVVVIIMALWML
jgi:DcuC family C4-dicarboxylate transporter